MIHSNAKLNRFIILLGITAFIGMGFLTLVHVGVSMEAGAEMSIFDCPFMNRGASVCEMSVMEHISMWRSLFSNAIVPALIAAMVLLWYFVLPYSENHMKKESFFIPVMDNSDSILSTSLSFAFSKGILNPKLH